MADLSRTYNVPLRKGYINAANYKKTNKAMATLKGFIIQHMKSDDIRIGRKLNEFMWKNGKKNPPHHVKVDCVRDAEETVRVELHGEKYEETVKSTKKEEPTSLKEKLQARLQSKEEPEEEKAETKKVETKKVETKKVEAKTVTKKVESKPVAKPAVKPVTKKVVSKKN